MDFRTSNEVIQDIKSLVNTKGFIYSLCLILIEDFHFSAEVMHQIDARSRLSKNEVSLIIGLLIQEKVSTEIPSSPIKLLESKKRTRELMEELHWSTMTPSFNKFKPLLEKFEKTPIQESPTKIDFFGGEDMFIEPIFYAGDGIYDFQYLEYLEKKYRYDEKWLNENSNFYFDKAINIVNRIKTLHQEKFRKVNFLSLRENKGEILKKLKKKKLFSSKELKENSETLYSIMEFYQFYNLFDVGPNLAKELQKNNVSEKGWNSFYAGLLDIFCISKSDFKINLDISDFLDNFTIPHKSENRNSNFQNIGDFNLFTAKPIIPLESGKYFVPITFSVFEAIYESPYYWIVKDIKYKDSLAKNRGKAGEEMTYNLLKKVFGVNSVFKALRIESKKGNDVTDIDVLCILGNKALCVQVKSKKLTQLSKKGDFKQLQKDFKGAVQDAFIQGLVCKTSVVNPNSKFFNEKNEEIKISENIDEVYILVVTTENYPTLTHQAYTLLEKKENDPYPLVLTIFDLELITHYLKDSYDLLYYIRQRINLMEHFKADEEMHYLGYHLINKLWKNESYDLEMITTEYGQQIDRNYYPYKLGIETSANTDPIRNRWKNQEFETLCKEISTLNSSKITDVIFHLLDLSQESRENLVKQIIVAKTKTNNDHKQHNFSILTGPIRSSFGLTYISWNNNDIQTLTERLLIQSQARKYKSKANLWVALGCIKDSGRMVDVIMFDNKNWEYDRLLEESSQILFGGKNNGKLIKFGKKIGRNDYCLCGSGLKYKKCCGRNY